MAGNRKNQKGGPGQDISYGEAARPTEPSRNAGVIDSERDARQESQVEERKPSSITPPTDEERIAERQGKAGVGNLTDHEGESERHGGLPPESEPVRH